MKLKTLLLTTMAALGLSMTSCSGLGFGVDVDSGGVSPYFYGNNYFGPLSLGASWNGGPIGGPLWGTPAPPPVVGNGPGSIGMVPQPVLRPQPTRPQQPVRPPQQQQPQPNRPQQSFRPAQNFGPSQSQPPLEVGPDLRPINNGSAPANRPGNYGLPN